MDKTIGRKVKGVREMAGLSQTQIAQFLNMDQSTVSKCEKGERQFQVDQLELLGSLFGCALADLLNAERNIKPLRITLRSDAIRTEDLVAIADIHKIALNLTQMRQWLEEASIEDEKRTQLPSE